MAAPSGGEGEGTEGAPVRALRPAAARAALRPVKQPADSEYLTVEDVAALLKVHPDTVRAMFARGDLPGVRLGRRWYCRRAALDSLFAAAEKGVDLGRYLP